ncbi:MAG TPA: hypothetical protein VI819_02470 [Patescibacteria group bacterium]|nr:hypothetical protein [Patescibacteria group bacterium]
MAIQNDFTIYPATKTIRHTSGTAVYDTVDFYTWLMDTFDEPGYLTYETPIRYNTPTSFTMINGWFLDNGDGDGVTVALGNILQYLTGGGIDTSGYSTVNDPILMVDMDGTTDFVYSDLDNTVVANTTEDVGPLLAFKNDYPAAGRARIWVRDTNTHGAISDNDTIAVTGGTGAGDALGASASGDEIYHNLFTIASFPTDVNPQVYVYQRHPVTAGSYNVRVRIAEWSAFTNWDRGSIDVLIPVQLGGAAIDGGNISTFVRQTGDTFTYVTSTLTSSGRTPIATETSADEVNITKGEHYLLYDTSNTGSFSVDDVISNRDLSAGIPPDWYAEVVAVDEFASTTEGMLTLRGLRGVIANNDAIFVSNVQEALVNGKVGDTYFTYTGGTDPTTLDQVMTGSSSGAKRILRGVDATENYLVLQDDPTITGSNRNAYYKDFTTGDTVTGATNGSVTPDATSVTLISGYNDITVAHVNGTIVVNGFSGTFLRGERVTWTGGGPAIVIYTDGSSTMTLGNVEDETALTTSGLTITGQRSTATCTTNGTGGMTDSNTQQFNFTLQSFAANYSVFIQGGSIYNASSEGRSLTDIYAYLQYYLRDGQDISSRVIYTSDASSILEVAAEEYVKADVDYSATKQAPFGTLAGGVFFGAQAVWVEGMSSTDNNNIKFTDAGGTLRQPFTSITLSITNTREFDRIAVYPKHLTLSLPNKTQYTSHATTNALSDTTFDAPDTVTFPNDTPTSGTFIVVDNSASEEHRYRYSAFDNLGGTGTNDGELFLPSDASQGGAVAGTATGGSDGQTLFDSAASFGGTEDVVVGDIIRRTNNEGGWAYVVTVNSTTQLTTTLFNAGITAGWDETATADAYEINELVVAYTGSDTFFIPYLDTIEDVGDDGSPGSVTQSLTYVSDRNVVVEVRNVQNTTQIQPFKTTGTIGSNGLTQSVIRNEDTVYGT